MALLRHPNSQAQTVFSFSFSYLFLEWEEGQTTGIILNNIFEWFLLVNIENEASTNL